MKNPICVAALFLLLLSSTSTDCLAQDGKVVFSKELGARHVAVFFDASTDTLTARLADGGLAVTVTLPSLTESFVDAIAFGNKVWLVSSFTSQSTVYVIDAVSGTLIDTILAANPAFSPDHRLMAYAHWAPRNDATNVGAVYLVYDITRTPQQNRMLTDSQGMQRYRDAGIAVYPAWNRQTASYSGRAEDQGQTYLRKSPLVWVEPNSFVFLSQASDTVAAVLVTLGDPGVLVAHVPVSVDAVVDAATLSPGTVPAGSITASSVIVLSVAPHLCAVRFVLSKDLKIDFLDIQFAR